MTDAGMNGRFYADGDTVFREPISEQTSRGQSITVGFPVCDVSEYLGGGAETLASILNQALDTGIIDGGRLQTFQARVQPWMMACFGAEISSDRVERADRFIEEALELVQAGGYTAERAHALVDYVFTRPKGEIPQEIGGVMVTLAAFCLAYGEDMSAAGETELKRIWTKVEQIRAKQAAKPKHSPLPVATDGEARS